MKNLIFYIFFLTLIVKVQAQNAEIRPGLGVAVPQFTSSFINTMTTQPKGTIVFDKDLNVMKYWDGAVWLPMSGGSGGLSLTANNIANTSSGNVGIGTATPTAKLDVATNILNSAVFGSSGTGISLQQNYPTIGFNQYRDFTDNPKYIGNGYAGGNYLDPTNGSFVWFNYPSGTAGAAATSQSNNMILENFGTLKPKGLANFNAGSPLPVGGDILSSVSAGGVLSTGHSVATGSGPLISFTNYNLLFDGSKIQARSGSFLSSSTSAANLLLNPFGGKIGINTGNSVISANLEVFRSPSSFNGTAVFKGTTHYTHFNYGTNEDTYIRGGKDGSNVVINDAPLGNVGIGTGSPFDKLTVLTPVNSFGLTHTNGTVELSTYAGPSLGEMGTKTNHNLGFFTNGSNAQMIINTNGNVGIGTNSALYKLEVNGNIRAKEVIVETGWADYVFEKDYRLRSIDELEEYLAENKHLPNVPSANEIEKNGLKIAETNKAMMEKIEELSLYIIQLNKKIEALTPKK
jgi:hypothetical protein